MGWFRATAPIARIGRPALESILLEVGGPRSTCAMVALGKMAELKLSSGSDLALEEQGLLASDFQNQVVPLLDREAARLRRSDTARDKVLLQRCEKTLGQIAAVVSQND